MTSVASIDGERARLLFEPMTPRRAGLADKLRRVWTTEATKAHATLSVARPPGFSCRIRPAPWGRLPPGRDVGANRCDIWNFAILRPPGNFWGNPGAHSPIRVLMKRICAVGRTHTPELYCCSEAVR